MSDADRDAAIAATAAAGEGAGDAAGGGAAEHEGGAESGSAAAAAAGDVGPRGPAVVSTEAVLEALLFVAERPLARSEIARLLACDRETVDALVGDLETTLAERGIRVVAAADHVALATAPEAGPIIALYVGAEPGRLSPAALEALAIVAYRQPVTKAVVERVRGVDSDYTLRSLMHRRLVVELGRADAPGRPILYGTGIDFLERFGLASLDDLPPLDAAVAGRLVDPEGAGIESRRAAPAGEVVEPVRSPGPPSRAADPGGTHLRAGD